MMRSFAKRSAQILLGVACAAASTAITAPALAQNVRIIVGGPPGGNTDIVARLVAARMGQATGSNIVVENRPGAGGTVAAEAVRNARPDGTTIGLITASNAANETLQTRKSFSLADDLETVGLYAWLANVLIVHPSLGAGSVNDLIAVLKSRAVTNYSSGGIGSPGHLAGETFRRRTGVAMTHVPYKGAPPAVLAVVSNEVSLMFATASAALPQIEGATVRALAVTSPERLSALSRVPTFAEAGLGGFDVRDWAGFVVPKGTPAETRDRLHRAFAAAFGDAGLRKRFEENTMIVATPALDPAAFREFLLRDIAKWSATIKDAGIEAQ